MSYMAINSEILEDIADAIREKDGNMTVMSPRQMPTRILGIENSVSNYEELQNLPKINGVEIKGDLSLSDLNLQKKNSVNVITLNIEEWVNNSLITNIEGITEEGLIQVSPIPSDIDAYAKAKIVCTEQGNGTLTFTCGNAPTSNLTVTVVNWG